MSAPPEKPLVVLIGGSFNPPHAGHFRIAIEAREALAPAEILFVPCSTPPHKASANLLPFALRLAMLQAVTDSLPESGLGVCAIEAERSGPSYTVDTLTVLAEQRPGVRPAFVMGSEDYGKFSTWRRWRDIPLLADLVVVPRARHAPGFFAATTLSCWPDALPPATDRPAASEAYALPTGGRVLYLPQPLLEISSSLVRERIVAGRSVDFLVPPPVLSLMKANMGLLRRLWR